MKCIAALKAMAMLWAQGKVVAEEWLWQLLSLTPPSLLFYGAPNASRHVAEVIVNPPNAATPALLHFVSQHNCLHRAEIAGQALFNCRAAAKPCEPTNTR